MELIKQKVNLVTNINEQEVYKFIEKIGRVSHKSEERMNEKSHEKFLKMLMKKQHLSVFEHYQITFHIITDRAVSHEFVRHRIASYTQESQRYVNYDDITFIVPVWWYDYLGAFLKKYPRYYPFFRESYEVIKEDQEMFEEIEIVLSHLSSLQSIFSLLETTPEKKRIILPNMVKTEFYATMNIRSWLHFLKLRTSKSAYPQMRDIALQIQKILQKKLPLIINNK